MQLHAARYPHLAPLIVNHCKLLDTVEIFTLPRHNDLIWHNISLTGSRVIFNGADAMKYAIVILSAAVVALVLSLTVVSVYAIGCRQEAIDAREHAEVEKKIALAAEATARAQVELVGR